MPKELILFCLLRLAVLRQEALPLLSSQHAPEALVQRDPLQGGPSRKS